jgi:ATP-binding cassette, subfamily C, bacterial
MSDDTILPVATGSQTRAWLRHEMRSRAGSVVLVLLAGVTAAAMSVVPVYVLGVLVDRIVEGSPTSVIVTIAIVVAVAAVLGGLALGSSAYLIGRLGAIALADLRERGVERALSLPTTTIERVGRGDVLSRVSTDVATIAKAVSDVVSTMFASILLGVLSLVAMVGLDWALRSARGALLRAGTAVVPPAIGAALRRGTAGHRRTLPGPDGEHDRRRHGPRL